MDKEFIKFGLKPSYRVFCVLGSILFLIFSCYGFFYNNEVLIKIVSVFLFIIGIIIFYLSNSNIKIYREKFSIFYRSFYFDKINNIIFQKIKNNIVLIIQVDNEIKKIHYIEDLFLYEKIKELLLDKNQIEYIFSKQNLIKKSYLLETIICMISFSFSFLISFFIFIILKRISLNSNLKTFIVLVIFIVIYHLFSNFLLKKIFNKKLEKYYF